jgi:putative SOS response-associated peptidase YedK
MCARLTLHTSPEELAMIFDFTIIPDLIARYNAAPSQPLAVIGLKSDDSTRNLVFMKWGLVPNWASDPNDGPKPINARSEGITTNPAFRDSIRQRRCIIPANGFYEWQTIGKNKIPHYFTHRDATPFAFAGIWDSWKQDDGTPLFTCSIVTTTSNETVRPLHDRMPVILPREVWQTWLKRKTALDDALALCLPFPAEQMQSRIVSTYVNKSTNEGIACVADPEA